jgi:hypothetical protein
MLLALTLRAATDNFACRFSRHCGTQNGRQHRHTNEQLFDHEADTPTRAEIATSPLRCQHRPHITHRPVLVLARPAEKVRPPGALLMLGMGCQISLAPG